MTQLDGSQIKNKQQNNIAQFQQLVLGQMLNRRAFKSYAPMHVVYRSKQFGTELWLGDYYAATDYHLLKNKNIKSVFTAAAMLGVAYPPDIQINHKTIHAFDMPSYKMTQHFQQAFNFIHEGLKKGNVLVHCAAGISRSTTCVLVYLMRQQGMSFNQALQMVRAKRSIVNPNYGFQNELKKYQLKLKKLSSQKDGAQSSSKKQLGDSEKNAVLNFLKQKNVDTLKQVEKSQARQQGQKMNSTLGYSLQKNQIYNGMLRGKSVNYAQKNNPLGSTMGYTGSKLTGQNRLSSMNKNQAALQWKKPDSLNELNSQFVSFKLEAPKIVTIKK